MMLSQIQQQFQSQFENETILSEKNQTKNTEHCQITKADSVHHLYGRFSFGGN